ncbi:MAG: ATP synthase F1 subunit epsilon [Faecousia sp.]
MSSFRLQIVTPDGSLFDGQAEALRLRTSEGYVSIRAGHVDYIAALDVGMVSVTKDGTTRDAACGGGFISVEKGEVRLVATTFEYADEIDVERAESAKKRAEERLAQAQEERDIALAKAKLSRALNRIDVAEKKA